MTAREFKERYVFDPQHDLIAEGTYTRVFKASDILLQRDICVKFFRKELIAGSPLIKELSRAGVFFHPNVCAFYDLIEIEETNVLGEVEKQPIGIVEYMNGGSLINYLQKHTDDAATTKRLIKDVIRGLSYLHSMGKPHLDLEPGNVLVKLTDKDPVAKITDFLNNENLHTTSVPASIQSLGLSYKAPEFFERSYGEQTAKADIWSLGLLVYEAVAGRRLFWSEGDTVDKVIRNICNTDYWAAVHELPAPYLSFVKRCLVRNPDDRDVSLEELTLILDGMKPAEVAAPVIPVAPPVAEVVPEPVVVPVPEPIVVAPPVVKAAPAPMPEPDGVDFEAAPSQPRKLDLSIPIIIISLLMLAAITAFIWKIVDDKDHTNSIPAIQTMHNGAVAPDTNKLAAMNRTDTITQIVHDTVKVIQVQQAAERMLPMADAKAAAPRSVATPKAKVHDMPVMPTYDYLYVDKPYYFDLKTPLLSKEEFDLYSENAAITPLGENTYYVKPTKAGPLTVVVATKGDHTKVIEAVYNVKTKPTPVAMLGDDIIGGFVSPKILLAKLTLQAKSEAGNYKVKSFRMTCRSGSCDINDVSNDGKFNESMIRFLHNVRSGERLYFDNITAEDESGQTVRLNDIQVTTY